MCRSLLLVVGDDGHITFTTVAFSELLHSAFVLSACDRRANLLTIVVIEVAFVRSFIHRRVWSLAIVNASLFPLWVLSNRTTTTVPVAVAC